MVIVIRTSHCTIQIGKIERSYRKQLAVPDHVHQGVNVALGCEVESGAHATGGTHDAFGGAAEKI